MPEPKLGVDHPLSRAQRLGIAALFVLGAMAISGGAFILSGIYNIGASRDHWSVTNFLITILRDRSISFAAGSIPIPDLDDPDLYLLGQEHFRGACTGCHGLPGGQINPVYQNMLPQPPDLTGAFHDYSANEIFWIVYNGLKYTGMPAWPADGRTDEVWSVVAFLQRLHIDGPGSYAQGGEATALTNCARCHGDEQTGPISNLVPDLDGLSEPYLARALDEYRSELRASGIMEPLAHQMSEEELQRLAGYYAALPPPQPQVGFPAEDIELGRRIATEGVPEQRVPACDSCHTGANPQTPRLQAQSARYMATQLDLWRHEGYRDVSAQGSLMAHAVRGLNESQALAVSRYYASQPVPEAAP
jgi:cytochrome c553